MAARGRHYRRGRRARGQGHQGRHLRRVRRVMDGVEGLVHISELAQLHREPAREVVEPGDDVRVKILEIDSIRQRLSLSVKRVEAAQAGSVPAAGAASGGGEGSDAGGDIGEVRDLGLSEDVFAGAQVEGAEELPRSRRRSRLRPRSRSPRARAGRARRATRG